jgi:ATP-dependent DNA ligase
MDPDSWRFRGMVGSGFNAADLKEISAQLQRLRVASPVIPQAGVPKGIIWVNPTRRCTVAFQEETPRGHFRAPVFIRLLE